MLDHESEMKAVRAGYVVMSLEEYNELRDQLVTASRAVYEAEQLAKRQVYEATKLAEDTLNSVLEVVKKPYSGDSLDISFNTRVVHDLAMRKLVSLCSEEELEGYTIVPAQDMYLCDETLARKKPSADAT